ncbi:MAG: glycoside hydrolase family 44 protein [Gemmatimonadaceae bacterium]|nr:glycoside hydrolase family 44 protein [Gemmatimonadaceae bacterium]
MSDAAQIVSRMLRHVRTSSALLLAATACGESEPTAAVTGPPPSIARATAIGLLTPYDSAAPFVRQAHDSQPSLLAVQLRDSLGQAVRQSGRTLTLALFELDGTASTRQQIRRGATAVSDTSGVARIGNLVLTGRAGSAILRATIDSLPPISIPLRLEAGQPSAAGSAVQVSPDTMAVGGAAQVVVVPMDASGNKRGIGQTVTATLDGDPALATISAFTFAAADSSYRATISVLAPAPARALRTSVNGTPLTTAPLFTGIAAPPPPPVPATALRLSTIPGDTASGFAVQSGALWPTTTVQLVDATGAPVRQAGVSVSARALDLGGAALAGATLSGGGAVSTNPLGQATFPALALTAPAGAARLQFDAASLRSTSLPVSLRPGALSTTRSTLSTSRDTVIVDSTVTISVVPRDAAGSALGTGQTVVLSLLGGSGASSGALGTVSYQATDSSYRATFTATGAGSANTVRATVNGTALSTTRTITVIVAPGVVVPSSPVTLTPDTIPVSGVAQLVTTPLDGAGRKLGPGQTVSIALSGGSSTATVGAVSYASADSSYRAGITGVTAGTATTVTTTVNGVALSATRQLTVSAAAPPPPRPASQLRITTLPGDTSAGGLDVQSGALISNVTVSLRDSTGAAVAQAGVAITASAVTSGGAAWTGATLSGAGPLSTGADGTITFPALRLTAAAGTGRIRFSATNLTAASLPVRVRAGAASTTTSTFALSSASIEVGSTSTAIVTLRDAANNKIGSGQTVAFVLGGGTSGVTIGAVTFTPSDSTYRATLTGSTVGTARVVSATVGGAALTTTRTLTVIAAAGADITATVNGGSTFEISRYIYGGNYVTDNDSYDNATKPTEFTFNRMGGNRLTAYNWENNYSNGGSDYFFQNNADVSTAPGNGVSRRATPTFARGQAFLATVPMIGYVSADACNCNVGTSDADRANRLATRFRISRATKGSAFTLTPNASDAFVYQDEFVNWFESTYPGRSSHPTAPVFFSLDNEPDIWHATHKQINSDLNDNASTPRLQTYTAFTDTSIVYAKAIKAVAPNALIFGPATATYTGLSLLGRYPTPDPIYGTQNFTDIYLDRMRVASAAAGRRLLDVFDLHYYPEMGTPNGAIVNDYATQDAAMIEARVQAPRSLWDPTYTDNSWVPGAAGGPLRLIPRIRDQIAARYPGTKIAITEYYYGRGGDISGGIAQADVFGIFGREGVFAASLWPFAGVNASPYNGNGNLAYAYIFGALRMYRNYDGAGSSFGDTGLQATTSNVAQSSIYASRTGAGRTVLVVINKTTTPKVTRITLNGVGSPTGAQVYLMQNGTPNPARQADVTISGNILTYTMPALSVSTLALTP